MDGVTERPQLDSYVKDYCEECVTKWSRCICKPESDWDDDQNYIVRTQTDSPSNVENNRHLIPSDCSDQEEFWNGKVSKRLPQDSDWGISDTQEDKNESDWNDNLNPQKYRAKSQPQAPSRQPLPGWPKGIRQQSLPSPISNMANDTNANITESTKIRGSIVTKEEGDLTLGQKL